MRTKIDSRICAQLDLSRLRWATRPATDWSPWVARTSAAAYRDWSPQLPIIRIQSLPGTLWEVLQDCAGRRHLIADDELVITLAELRLLSSGTAAIDSGYDHMMLLLADGFRGFGNMRYYAACMGSLLPRLTDISNARRAALAAPAFSAGSVVVLLHELAHQVLRALPEATSIWRELALHAIAKVAAALQNSEMRDRAIRDAEGFGLEHDKASAQIETYLARLQSSPKLHEELTCDLLAAVSFLNLQTPANILTKVDQGPVGMSTKEVGEALFVAHGTLQNLQLVAAAEEIAATVLDPLRQRGIPGPTLLEFTARSSALVFLLNNVLQSWCDTGALCDELAKRIAGGESQFLSAVAKRNSARQRALLGPLEVLDGILIDEERFVQFEAESLRHLERNGIDGSRDLEQLDSMRWGFTLTEAGINREDQNQSFSRLLDYARNPAFVPVL